MLRVEHIGSLSPVELREANYSEMRGFLPREKRKMIRETEGIVLVTPQLIPCKLPLLVIMIFYLTKYCQYLYRRIHNITDRPNLFMIIIY